MAHLVQQMAYVGQTPWHGLGNELSGNQPIEVWAEQAGMNWTIQEANVQYVVSSDPTHRTTMTYPDSKVLFRSDTLSALSVVSQRYKVVQPREILEFYHDLTEQSGFELQTAGVLKGGRKLWALAKTGQSTAIKGKDVTNGYVLLATACDGTLATTAQFTTIRVVCNNTLAVAFEKGQDAIKVPHNSVFNPETVKRQLGISVSSWDNFMYRMKLLSERPVKSLEADDYFLHIFTETNGSLNGKPNEKAMAKALSMFNGQGRGAELSSSKGTALGLLNAMTEFVDHERRARNSDYRLDSAWFGQGAAIKQKALDQALLLLA